MGRGQEKGIGLEEGIRLRGCKDGDRWGWEKG